MKKSISIVLFFVLVNVGFAQIDANSIPNIITPNGDNINDTFSINESSYTKKELQIFNRWGVKVFESLNYGSDWNGVTSSGVNLPSGTYYYILTSNNNSFKGYLSLLRQ